MINTLPNDGMSEKWWNNTKVGGSVLDLVISGNDINMNLRQLVIEELYGGGYYEIICTYAEHKPSVMRDVFFLTKSIEDYDTLKTFRRFYNIGGPL